MWLLLVGLLEVGLLEVHVVHPEILIWIVHLILKPSSTQCINIPLEIGGVVIVVEIIVLSLLILSKLGLDALFVLFSLPFHRPNPHLP